MYPTSNEDGEPLDRALCGFQQLEMPPRPNDEKILEAIARDTSSKHVRVATMAQRLSKIPAALRYVAAVGALAAMVILLLGLRSDSVLLAEVADAMAKHKTVRFMMIQLDEQGNPDTPKVPCYWTLDSRHFRYFAEQDGKLHTFDYIAGQILITDPKRQSAKLIFFTKEDAGEPRLEMWQVVRDERDSKATKETVNGQEFLVFQLTKDKDARHTIETIVCADPKTKLPLKIDWKRITKDENNPKNNLVEHSLMSDFVWDPPEAEDIDIYFSTVPPAGYKVEFTKVE